MDESEQLRARLDALEAEHLRMRATLDVLAAWAVRYGVRFTATDAASPSAAGSVNVEAGASVQVANVPAARAAIAAPAKKPLSGEQLLVRVMYGIGLLVLLVGAAVILPATLSLLSVQARDILGVLIGLAILAVGARAKSRTIIVDGAVALGAGLEYLSLWNAFHLKLAPVEMSFALMFATTLLVGALSYAHRSQRLAFAGLLGGAITPILLATDHPNVFGLCVYLAVLTATALTLAILRNFRYLEFAAFVVLLAYSPAWAWETSFSQAWSPQEALIATFVFFGELAAALLVGARRGTVDLARQVLLTLELCAFALVLDQRETTAEALYLGAFVAFTALLLVAARAPKIDAALRVPLAWWGLGGAALIVQSLIFAGVGGPIAVEGAVLAGLGARRSDDRVRLGSAVAFAIAGIALPFDATLDAIFRSSSEHPFLNSVFALAAILVASLAAAIEFERRADKPQRGWLDLLRAAFHVTASFVLARQAYDLNVGDELRNLAVTLALTLYAAGLLAAGIRRKVAILRVFGVALFLITVCKAFVVDLAGVDAGLRFFSFLALGGALVVTALFYKRAVDRAAPEVSK